MLKESFNQITNKLANSSILEPMEKSINEKEEIKETRETTWDKHRIEGIHSLMLDRVVNIEVFTPPFFKSSSQPLPVLILNDGQDSETMNLLDILNKLQKEDLIQPFIVAGVFCGDRIQEYGVASKPDYKKRGSRAKAYSRFVIEHLLPTLLHRFRIDLNHPQNAIAGYSMGGLSALDIAWNHPEYFPRVGAFSGSFWWRKRALDQGYTEHDRIIHQLIRKSRLRKGMKFWFMAGTKDETADRNKNGIIDAIDDTLDLVAELIKLGYKPYYDVVYHEVKNGKHDVPTWGKAMPEFLKWAFGKPL
ncbi:MAG: alpha/beta hydrolase-fold protein [Bacteroidia bacterium]